LAELEAEPYIERDLGEERMVIVSRHRRGYDRRDHPHFSVFQISIVVVNLS
jgi:hypothetical protein